MVFLNITIVLAWELIILIFALLTNNFPGKKLYRDHVETIQLIISVIVFLIGIVDYVYVAQNYPLGMFEGSKWDAEGMKIFLMMYALIFASSVYKYVVFRKNDGNNRVSIELRKEDYTLKKDFDLVLGDYIYMPNVQSYCEFEDGIILFTATAPEKNMDAEFVCKKVKDRVYECVYFDSVNESDFRISGKVLTIIAFILAAVDVILMVHWIAYSENREFLGELIECISIFDFGFGLSKLLKGAEGVGSKFMYGFSIFLMIISIMSFFFIFI